MIILECSGLWAALAIVSEWAVWITEASVDTAYQLAVIKATSSGGQLMAGQWNSQCRINHCHQATRRVCACVCVCVCACVYVCVREQALCVSAQVYLWQVYLPAVVTPKSDFSILIYFLLARSLAHSPTHSFTYTLSLRYIQIRYKLLNKTITVAYHQLPTPKVTQTDTLRNCVLL